MSDQAKFQKMLEVLLLLDCQYGRTIAELRPADVRGVVPNGVMTWGVVVKDGLAYVNDMMNGLWIVRLRPRTVVP